MQQHHTSNSMDNIPGNRNSCLTCRIGLALHGMRLGFISLVLALSVIVSTTVHAEQAEQKGSLPPGLIANVGQWPSHVLFLSRQAGTDVWITRDGLEIDRYSIAASGQLRNGTVEHQRYFDSNPAARVTSGKELYRINIFRGNAAEQWFSVPVYSSVKLRDFLPGVDVQFDLSDEGLGQEFLPTQGAGISAFSVLIDGSESVRLMSASRRKMLYVSDIGGSGFDQPAGMVRMKNGDVVVAGTTDAMTYDTRLGKYSKSIKGNQDGFLVRLNSNLQKVISYTFFGGDGNDRIIDLVVGTNDAIYITGETESYNLPATAAASSNTYALQTDAFVAGFDSELSKLLFCTYHGGIEEDRPVAIAVDAQENICILGNTTSPHMPTTFPATTTGIGGGISYGNRDMFIASFSRTGFLQRGRFIGSSGDEIAASMVLDASNNMFIVGSTTTPSFSSSVKGRFSGGRTDAFIMKLDPHMLVRSAESRLFGGTADDRPVDAVIDSLGRIVVTGVTTSKDFPTMGEVGTMAAGGQDVFFTVFGKDGTSIRQSGYVGGTRSDSVAKVIMDSRTGSMILLGQTQSFDFPVSEGDADSDRSGETDGFIVRVEGNRITSSQLIGGDGSDIIVDGWVDSLDRVVFLGSTSSTDINVPNVSAAGNASGGSIILGRCFDGSISLYMPAGGETFCAGTTMPVRWTTNAIGESERYTIEVSRSGSDQWTVIASGLTGSSHHVAVPALREGDYLLRVSTSRGHVDQLMSAVRITEAPRVTVQPQSVDICGDESAELGIQATGRDLTYQWRRNGEAIAGATSSTLVVRAAEIDQKVLFDCQITNPCGVKIKSASAEVRLGKPPAITLQPTDQMVRPGSGFMLIVGAEGAGLSYQWWRNGTPLTNQQSAVLRVSSATSTEEGSYFCAVTGSCGTGMSDTVMVRLLTTSVTDRREEAETLHALAADGDDNHVRLRLVLEASSPVQVLMVDINGRTVSSLSMAALDRGVHELRVPSGQCSLGMYTAVVVTDRTVLSVPLIVQR